MWNAIKQYAGNKVIGAALAGSLLCASPANAQSLETLVERDKYDFRLRDTYEATAQPFLNTYPGYPNNSPYGSQSKSGCGNTCIGLGAVIAGISGVVLFIITKKDFETRDRETVEDVAFQEGKKPHAWILSGLGLAGGIGLMIYGFSTKGSSPADYPPAYPPPNIPPAAQPPYPVQQPHQSSTSGTAFGEPAHCTQARNTIQRHISDDFRFYRVERDSLYFRNEKIEYSRINGVLSLKEPDIPSHVEAVWVRSGRVRPERFLKIDIQESDDHYLQGEWDERKTEEIDAAFRTLRRCVDPSGSSSPEQKAETKKSSLTSDETAYSCQSACHHFTTECCAQEPEKCEGKDYAGCYRTCNEQSWPQEKLEYWSEHCGEEVQKNESTGKQASQATAGTEQKICIDARDTVASYLSEACGFSQAGNDSFSCKGKEIQYESITATKLKYRDRWLYIYADKERYKLRGDWDQEILGEINDAFAVLRQCANSSQRAAQEQTAQTEPQTETGRTGESYERSNTCNDACGRIINVCCEEGFFNCKRISYNSCLESCQQQDWSQEKIDCWMESCDKECKTMR